MRGRNLFCKKLTKRLHIKVGQVEDIDSLIQLDAIDEDKFQQSVGNFVSFVVENDIREIKYASDGILNRRFKDSICNMKYYPFYDHARLMVARDGKYCLVLQPYLKKEEVEDILKSANVPSIYGVMDSDDSWYNVGKSVVAVIWEDSVEA